MNKEGWTYKRLGEVISEYSERCRENEYPIYSVTNSQGFCQQFFGKRVASSDIANYKVVPKGYFAYNPSRINVGSIACQNKEMKVCVSPLYTVFSSSNQIDTSFLLYFLKSPDCNYIINAYARGTVRNNLKFSQLEKIKAPVPPLSVQQRIVSELDQLSDIIAMKRKQVEEYDALTQSVFYEMFGDPIINDKGWNVSKLSNVVSFKNGLNFKQSDLGETFKFIGVGDFGEKKFIDCEYLENYVHINETIPSEYFLQDNDIVIVRSNGSKNLVGRGMLVKTGKTRTLYSGFCIRCRISDPNALSPTFLITFLMNRSIKFILRNEGRGANISNINQKMLSNLPIPLPSLPLQHAFAAKVRAIERQKQLVNDSIRELQTLLDSRMQEYFG